MSTNRGRAPASNARLAADPPSVAEHTRPASKGRPSGQATKLRIRAAASKLFSERGYHAATMREIAAAAGVKVGSLYNHYEGKEELLFNIAYETMAEMVDGGRAAVAERDTAETQFRAYVQFHIRYCVARMFEARVADDFLHALNPQLQRAVIRLRDDYEEVLRDVLRRGERHDGWIVDDIALIAFGVVTMITDVRLWYRPGGRLSLDDISNYYTNFFLRAFGSNSATNI